MKKIDYKNNTKAELSKMIAEKRNAVKAFRFGIAGSRVKNVREGRALRAEVARMMTALRNAK